MQRWDTVEGERREKTFELIDESILKSENRQINRYRVERIGRRTSCDVVLMVWEGLLREACEKHVIAS